MKKLLIFGAVAAAAAVVAAVVTKKKREAEESEDYNYDDCALCDDFDSFDPDEIPADKADSIGIFSDEELLDELEDTVESDEV